MSTLGRVRTGAFVAVTLLAAAESAQAQRRTVSTAPVAPPAGVARTPNPPPPPPPPPSHITPPPAPPAAPPAARPPAPTRPGSAPAPAPPAAPGRDTILVPVVVGVNPAVYNGNYVATGGGYVLQAPPAPQLESRPSQPYPAMAWIPGRYEWNGASYFWRAGEWVYIPAGYVAWVPGEWKNNQYGWFWVNGYWRQ